MTLIHLITFVLRCIWTSFPFALQDSKLNKEQIYTCVSYRSTPRTLLYWLKQFTQRTYTETDRGQGVNSAKYWARTSSFWEVSPTAIWNHLRSSEMSVPAINISALMKLAQRGLLVPLAMSTHTENAFS